MKKTTLSPQNPAFELYDLLSSGWVEVPAKKTALQARMDSLTNSDKSDLWYPERQLWHQMEHANALVDQIEEYLQDMAKFTRRPSSGGATIERLRAGINNPGDRGLLATKAAAWDAFYYEDIDWLNSIGQTWDRHKLAPHLSSMPEVKTVASLVTDLVNQTPDLSSMHKEYLLTLSDALGKAAGAAAEEGEIPVTRLAVELRGALDNFLPNDDEQVRSLKARLGNFGRDFLIAISPKVAAELLTRPEVIHAIEAGAHSVGL